MVKHTFIFIIIVFFTALIGCQQKSKNISLVLKDSLNQVEIVDSTAYGICGEGTAMHVLELLTDTGDSISYFINDTETEPSSTVLGGLLSGDKMAVISTKINNENIALRILNISTLLGRWKSIDKDFSIEEGGTIKSFIANERQTWNVWKICNGYLVLNKDTFIVNTLGADSLALENKDGIFVYKRSN